MSCSPADFLNLAESISQQNSCSEIESRCAISRAYYAALHSVDFFFQKTEMDMRIEGESSHAEIIRRAREYGRGIQPGRTNAAVVAKLMSRLKADRNQADYRLGDSIDSIQMQDVILRVKRVMNECEEIDRKRETQ